MEYYDTTINDLYLNHDSSAIKDIDHFKLYVLNL